MRLHNLEITAFGPFAETVRLDFDALGDAGLFLLTGSTGAGKTSLLDAVCFGLYGQVPGDRQHAARLRSDHAPAGVAPRVQLELTVAGRALRIIRSPAWQRPKARGVGLTAQPATATVAQRRDGAWETLATRIPDVAQVVTAAIGMDLHQFTQVVMLPQGRFSEFLRSGADTRKAVLERLFATSRYRDLERWLVDRRQQTGRTCERLRAGARTLVDQIAAVAASAAPDDDWTLWQPWAAQTLRDLGDRAERARREVGDLDAETRLLTDRLGRAERQEQLRAAGRQAGSRLAELAGSEAELQSFAERVERAERARGAVALLGPLDAADTAVAQGRRELQDAERLARRSGVDPCRATSDVAARADEVAAQRRGFEAVLTRLEPLGPVAERCRELAVEIVNLDDQAAAITAELAGIAQELELLPRRAEALAGQIETARAVAADEVTLRERLLGARDTAVAAAAVPSARADLAAAEADRAAAIDSHNDARDRLNDIRDRRLDGAAAWLAGQLVADQACPVCGGCEHPSPALGVDEVPTEADESRARTTTREAEAVRAGREATVQRCAEALLRLRERASDREPSVAAGIVADLERRVEVARRSAEQCGDLEAERTAFESAGDAARARRADISARAAVVAELASLRREERQRLQESLDELVGRGADLETRRAWVAQQIEASDQLASALHRLVESNRLRSAVHAHAESAARAAGLAGVPEIAKQAIPAKELEAMRERVETSGRAREEAAATLADPQVLAALAAEPEDATSLLAELRVVQGRHRDAVAASGVMIGRAEQVELLERALATACDSWEPTRRAHDVADALAGLAEGKSADNHPKMSLSAYVLAARLAQVVSAANERLGPMTSGRYLLEHCVERDAGSRGRAGGGLGLRVDDAWTGHTRDPRTLSGGETFQVSLALALGLADVVTAESGGVHMQSLFVDEGFGSLDADSLEDVMDVLDDLRSSGRVVGLVSHVEGMRERIPAQVRVVKGRNGSRVCNG